MTRPAVLVSQADSIPLQVLTNLQEVQLCLWLLAHIKPGTCVYSNEYSASPRDRLVVRDSQGVMPEVAILACGSVPG